MSTPAEVQAQSPGLTNVGFNVLLEGPSGVGKTHSLGTLVDTGLHVHTLFLESGQETLLGYYTDRGLSVPDNLHIHHLRTGTASFTSLLDSAKKTNTLPYKMLCEMTDPNRGKYDSFFHILNALNEYTDQRTGESFGGVDSWGVDRVIAIDGLTGICRAAMQCVVGGRITIGKPDYGQAQSLVRELLQLLTNGCRCHVVLIAHIDRYIDDIVGGNKIFPKSVGQALTSEIPTMFSEVVLAKCEGNKYLWTTAEPGADLKCRNLLRSGNLPPDFGPIYTKWKSRIEGVRNE